MTAVATTVQVGQSDRSNRCIPTLGPGGNVGVGNVNFGQVNQMTTDFDSDSDIGFNSNPLGTPFSSFGRSFGQRSFYSGGMPYSGYGYGDQDAYGSMPHAFHSHRRAQHSAPTHPPPAPFYPASSHANSHATPTYNHYPVAAAARQFSTYMQHAPPRIKAPLKTAKLGVSPKQTKRLEHRPVFHVLSGPLNSDVHDASTNSTVTTTTAIAARSNTTEPAGTFVNLEQ